MNDNLFAKNFHAYLKKVKPTQGVSCFTIANTAKMIDRYYFTPVRVIENIQVCGVVVSNTLEARAFAKLADGRFDYIAVDSEKKLASSRYISADDQGNITGEVCDTVTTSQVISFKANDITVEAIDIFISDTLIHQPAEKVAIVGVGNIGFKLALKLVERGYWINLFRRDYQKLKLQADCIDLTKPKGTLAEAFPCQTLSNCLKGASVVIAAADSSFIISSQDLAQTLPNPLLIDCGKACFANEVCDSRMVYRTDVGMALLYQLKMIIHSCRLLHPKFGRRVVNKKRYVCGVSGLKGDVVLSDIQDIGSSIGVCNGKGGLVKVTE